MLTSSTQNRYDMHMLAIERGRQFKRLRKIKKTLNKVQKRIKDIPDHSIKVEELLFSYHQLVDKKLFPPNCKPLAYKTILEFGFEDEERKQEIKENLFFESTQEIIMAYRSFEETFLTREKETEKLNKLVR